MRTPICDRLGIEFPIFAFSHCRDVVAAVSKAGGYGVLGALAYAPDQLEIELSWIDEHVDGKPYGVDFAMPAKYVGKGGGAERERRQPARDDPRRAPAVRRGAARRARRAAAARRPPDRRGEGRRARRRRGGPGPGRGRARAPGVDGRQRARPAAARTSSSRRTSAASSSAVWSANRSTPSARSTQGVDVIVAQGTEAGGHCGDVSTMVLVPEVVDAVGPDVPVLAAGGIGRGRQMAAALALGAQGVWTGSIWLTVAESRHQPDRGREDARRELARHRALAVDDGQAGAPAAHRVDRRVGARRHARPAADAAAGHRVLRGGAPRRPARRTASSPGSRSGQIVGSMNRCARSAT